MSEDETSDGEDWFEEALEDDDTGIEEPTGESGDWAEDEREETAEFGEGAHDREGAESAVPEDVAEETDDWMERDTGETDDSGTVDTGTDSTDTESTAEDVADTEPTSEVDESSETGSGAFDSEAAFGDDTDDTERPFEDDEPDALGDDGDVSAFGAGDGSDAGAFGDEGASGAFGGDGDTAIGGDAGAGDEEGLFDDDFASAFESGGGEFEEAEFESSIPRIDLGIEGLDEMIQGGIPERHLIVTIGAAGAGKTTFGLQFLHHGLQQGDKGVFITLEQSRETIVDTANERGWEFDRHEREDNLAVVDLDPVEMANSLDNIRGELPELIKDFGADRLVLDSVSLLEMMYDDQARRRTEVFDFTRSLKNAGVTTFLTSEANENNPYASRHGIIEYLTDAVFILQYVRGESRETRLAVEIQKIRNANHSREQKPYDITMDGISVYQQANIF